MHRKYSITRISAIFSVAILVAVVFHPAMNPVWDHISSLSDEEYELFSSLAYVSEADSSIVLNMQPENDVDIPELNSIAEANSDVDTDNDGLYDSVEKVIGTDLKNCDSDFDGLSDYDESINHLTNPMEPDSNNDGIVDYFEVTNVPLDVDNDGTANAWDYDNDGDNVPDVSDMSPFSYSEIKSNFHFDIQTTGKPTYIDFQIKPSNSNYLKLAQQTWNWPNDDKGSMTDLDNSEEDVIIIPTLEVTIPTDFKISAKHSHKCLEVDNASMEDGANIQQSTYADLENQLWDLEFFEEGYYKIISKNSGKCLEVFNASTDDGANVQQSNISYHDNQLWRFEPVSEGYYNIIAKHSGKCLEVFNEDTEDGGNIQQNDYWSLGHQLWKLEPIGTYIPPIEDMIDYGIVVELNKLSIPLSPVYDYGTTVALKGRLFYPPTMYTNISMDMQLVWKVSGDTDKKVDVLKASNGFNVSVSSNNVTGIIANESDSPEQEKFEFKDLGNKKVAIGTYNGLFVTATDNEEFELIGNSSSIDEQEMFTTTDLGDNKIALEAWNEKYVAVDNEQGLLVANSSTIGIHETFELIDAGYVSNVITLARYKENFMFTGFSTQENYGSDASLFYSTDENQTLAASFIMAYEFLRNNQTSLTDMQQYVIPDNNVTVNSTITTDIAHMDLAILELTSNITIAALEELDNKTDDKILPIIIALEDEFSIYTMDEFSYGEYNGDTFSINNSNLQTATAKYFKLGWYNTASKEVLNEEEFLKEIKDWGIAKGLGESSEALDTYMSIILAWNVGESRVIKIGTDYIEVNSPEAPMVLDKIQAYGLFTVSGLIDIAELVRKGASSAYKFLKPCLGQSSKVLKALQSTYKALNGAKVTKAFKYIGKVSKVLFVIDLVISFVIGLYSWFSFADDHGWSDFGVYVGWLSYMVIINWAGLYAALCILGGPVGALIALALAIFDIIFGIGDIIMGWIIDLFTRIDQRSNIDIDFVGDPLVNADDIDDNGIDGGDLIEYKCKVAGNVTRTSDGNWGDVCQSYVTPYLTLNVPPNSNWGSTSQLTQTIYGYPNYRYETYKLGAWVEARNMVNFPITVKLAYNYRVYYDECWWFFGWHCDRESTSSRSVNDLTTMHFDVMPEDIIDFLAWNEITSSDNDGDRLTNNEEIDYTANPWNSDTDGDGLWDGFEVDIKTLTYIADSDSDGLGDKRELQLNTDPLVTDTDNDTLTDYEEWRGWSIEFNFFGTEFAMHVSSDPLENDSDGDGLSDIEEYMKNLNPKSKDTNGDGVDDYNESRFPSYGLITDVSFNGKGNSIRVSPNETISTVIKYRVLGIERPDTGQPDNCSLIITLKGSNYTQEIFNGKPSVGLISENSTTFTINNSLANGSYLMQYYILWNYSGALPPELKREIIGFIEVNTTGSGAITWECFGDGTDTDGDFIIDVNEIIGWPVTYTDISGEHTINVTSDHRVVDTDGDGLSDLWEHNCYSNSTNPRDVDTDHDGLTDPTEIITGTNPLHYDTDHDSLDDSTEINFRSNPNLIDTDFDGLNDSIEFKLNSNPNKPDTDSDGLSDYEEYMFNSSLIIADTDSDLLFDKMEYNLTTNPRNPDTDEDGLIDGYEVFLNTDPKNNDTDFDGLNDSAEIHWMTDPLLSDTDNDSLNDGDEIFYGSHPLIEDTDFDGVNDSEDLDTYAPHVDNIILAYDIDQDVLDFMDNLDIYTNITIVSAEELLSNSNYYNASNIVLIGRPDAGSETVGNITYNILNESGDNISEMIDSDYNRLAVKYGVWNNTQTIVMISHPYHSDHWIVLNILKAKRQTILPNSIEVQYPTPRDLFYVEAIKHIDSTIWVELNGTAKPWIKMTRYNTSATPFALTHTMGLNSNEENTGKYLEINLSENIQNKTRDIIDEAWIIIHYTASDLDRTGDGDAKDVGDINENSLKFYFFSEETRKWIKVTDDLDWVFETGVDTANVELYGKNYEGYIWAKVSHFSLYGIAGNLITPGGGGGSSSSSYTTDFPPNADASASEEFGFINTPITFDASRSTDDSRIINYNWDFGDGDTDSGQQTTHIYSEIGTYTVKLTVTDDSGKTDTDTISVTITIANNPPTKPIVNGPTEGESGIKYSFIAISEDNDINDLLRYGWDWDNDNTVDEWTDFYNSGETSIINHTFNEAGFYRVRAQSEDNNSALSGWSNQLLIFIDVDYLQQEDGTYLIDYEKDGTWDYVYDPNNDELVDYKENISYTYIALIFIVILVIISYLIIKRKKGEAEKQKEKTVEKDKKQNKKQTKKKK